MHFSIIEGTGYRELVEGEPIDFDVEAVTQDSFDFRWLSVSSRARIKRPRGDR